MTKFNIARAFDHKTHGRIGTVEMVANVTDITINGKKVPDASIEYLLTFALQNLQDAYAGADNATDAEARWAKKLDRLLKGEIGTREAGDGASQLTVAIRGVIAESLRALGKWKEVIGALDEDKRGDKLDEIFAKQPEAKQADITEKAKAKLAEAAARKAAAKEMASGLDL